MSEINTTPEELVEQIELTVDDAPIEGISMSVDDARVIPIPIDPTLTIQGEAADAKATGDAIVASVNALRVNSKAPVNNEITVYGTDIDLSSAEGAQTVAEAVEAIGNRTAANIIYDPDNLTTIKGALDDIYFLLDTELTEGEIDEIIDDVFGGES